VFESFYHLLSNVVVYDVLEINKIKVVSPGMKNTETLMFDSLNSVLLNVFFYELVGCFISRDWVGKIIGINGFLRVANERANRFDARRWLQILVFDVSVEQLGKTIKASDIKLFEQTDQYLLETFQIPVLVDTGVDDMGSENLLSFVRQKEHQVVDSIDFVVIVFKLGAELWK